MSAAILLQERLQNVAQMPQKTKGIVYSIVITLYCYGGYIKTTSALLLANKNRRIIQAIPTQYNKQLMT